MATSYANSLGTGDRRGSILIIHDLNLFNTESTLEFIDGAVANGNYVPSGTGFQGKKVTFDFRTGKIIDELRVNTEFANNQGTWQVSGSNDGVNFTNIGSPVAFTVATPAVLAFTNSTSYRYYRLTGSSGTITQTYWREIEFKIDQGSTTPASATTYSDALSTGNRTSTITVTASAGLFNSGNTNMSILVDGNTANTADFIPNGTGFQTKTIVIDFVSTVILDEIKLYNQAITEQGTWTVSGSNDGSSYTGLGDWPFQRTALKVMGFFNQTGYRFYKLTGLSGTIAQSYWDELEFRVTVTNPGLVSSDTLNNWGENQKLGYGNILADNAANLADAVIRTLGYPETPSDNLRNWADSVTYTRYDALTPLSVTVADTFMNLTGPPSQRFSWKDGQIVNLDNKSLFVGVDDLGAFLTDDVATSLVVFFNSVSGTAFDTMMYGWSDSINVAESIALQVGDSIALIDSLSLFSALFLSPSDTLSMSDSVSRYPFGNVAVSDTLSMTDAVAVNNALKLTVSVGDTMSFSDDIQKLVGGSFNIYIRRYLNDVQGLNIDIVPVPPLQPPPVPPPVITPPASVFPLMVLGSSPQSPSFGGERLFPPSIFWQKSNTRLVDPSSATWINAMGASQGVVLRTTAPPSITDGWGERAYGVPYYIVDKNQTQVEIVYDTNTLAQSVDKECYPGPYFGTMPIPLPPKVKGGYFQGVWSQNFSGDKHTVTVDKDNGYVYETWNTNYIGDGKIHAGAGVRYDARLGDAQYPVFTNTATVSGIPYIQGMIRYDEVATGVISHALAFTALGPWGRAACTFPATHHQYNNINDPNLPPFGALIRLKSSFDISSFPTQSKVVLKALQDYGAYYIDGGANIELIWAMDDRWDWIDVATLTQVALTNFEFCKIETPIYSDTIGGLKP